MSALAVLAIGGMVGAFVAGRVSSSSQRASVATAPSRSIVAASVQQGPLKEIVQLNGLVEVPAGIPLRVPQQSTSLRAIYTDILLVPGQTVANGDVVAEVSGRPVFAIRGEFPFYRDLHIGDSGPDVRQLQQALREILGLPRNTGTLDMSTAHALDKLYASSGYRATTEPAPVTNVPNVTSSPSPHASASSKAESIATSQSAPSRIFMSSAEFVVVARMPTTVKDVKAQLGADATGDIATTVVGSPRIVVGIPPARQYEVSLWGSSTKGMATIGIQTFKVTLDTQGSAPKSQTSPSSSPNDLKLSPISAVFVAASDDLARAVGKAATVDVTLRQSDPGSLVLPLSGLWTDSTGQTSVRLVDRGLESASIPVRVSLVVDGMAAVSSNDARLRVGASVLTGYASATNPSGLSLPAPAGS